MQVEVVWGTNYINKLLGFQVLGPQQLSMRVRCVSHVASTGL